MQITIRFFATLRDRAGIEQTTLTLPDSSSVALLLDQLAAVYPKLAPSLSSALVAVNEEFAFPDDMLRDGDTLALFPPVSGGADTGHHPQWPEYLAITSEPLDFDHIITTITRPETGGICLFTGTVRGVTAQEGATRETEHLVYEAYTEMAEKKVNQVAHEIRERFPKVQGIAIVQRVGKLQAGEITVLVACAAGHRHDDIFDAARYGIDRLKEIVPVWKKEVGPDGSRWVEGRYYPTQDDISDA